MLDIVLGQRELPFVLGHVLELRKEAPVLQ
jgi:hypothetical protein